MRALLSHLLLLACLGVAASAHRGGGRKTLNFGPAHPHARFHASPYDITTRSFIPVDVDTDPYQVARLFLNDLLTHEDGFRIRTDSYTDRTTGITHVYVKQVVNGLDVVDGDINLNIKDGMILSYGNSFYNDQLPQPFSNTFDMPHEIQRPHEHFCSSLQSSLPPLVDAPLQVPFNPLDHGPIQQLLDDHCTTALLSHDTFSDDPSDIRPALLKFMHFATPNSTLASSISADPSSYIDQMIPIPSVAPPTGESGYDMFQVLVDNVPDAINPVKGRLAYIQVPSSEGETMHLQLVWHLEVEMRDNWYQSAVSTYPPYDIVSVVDWARDSPVGGGLFAAAPIPEPPSNGPASYLVFPWGINDPSCGNRTFVKEEYDAIASPMGWHAIPFSKDPSIDSRTRRTASSKKAFWRNTTTTWGNNVFAQENWEGQNAFIDNFRPDAGRTRIFNYTYAPKKTNSTDAQDEAYKYINATLTQLFYTANLVHDLYFRYGFDEVSGNFQQHNFGSEGKDGDAVIANAQDGSGYNNANFMTPPDGTNGRMRMYLWNTALPYRDGDLEAGIVVHELSHGLSTRLTGGPANSGCLGWGESGGMGEGWGDFLATTIRSSEVYEDYPMGEWAANREGGIRNYPYSLNTTINPTLYKTLDQPGYWGVHAIGEVWAEMLWVVSQKLIAKHGFSSTLFPPKPVMDDETGEIIVPEGDFYRPSSSATLPGQKKKAPIPIHGNTLITQLVLDGMKLQPCRPSFFEARNAIIAADQQLTGGENFCEIWRGFAERGLGSDARVRDRTPWGGGVRTNGYAVPVACAETTVI